MSGGLVLEGITKRFGGLTALENVTFTVEPGEVFALVGPNGAGKSTVFNVISRFYTPEEGSAHFEGENLLNYPAHDIARLGIARTFQNIGPKFLFHLTGGIVRHENGAGARGENIHCGIVAALRN